MNIGTLFEPSKISVVSTLLIEILDAFLDTPKPQCFWGIVRNISLPFTSFRRSEVAKRKTTGRRERPNGMPLEGVRNRRTLAAFAPKLRSTQNANARLLLPLRTDKCRETVARCGVY